MKRRVKTPKKRETLSVLMLITLLLVWGCGGNGDVTEPQGEETSQVEEKPAVPEFEEPEQVVVEEKEEEEEKQDQVVVEEEKEEVIEEEQEVVVEEQEGLGVEELGNLLKSSKVLDELYYEIYYTNSRELEISEEETDDVEMIVRVYSKNGVIRIETDYLGYISVEIFDVDAYYLLDDESKIAYKTPLDLVLDEPLTLDFYIDDVDESNMNYVGKETIQGVSCHVVECKGLNTGFNRKMWLHEEYGLPIRAESNYDGEDFPVMRVIEFQVGNLSDDFFRVPEGYMIEEIDEYIPIMP